MLPEDEESSSSILVKKYELLPLMKDNVMYSLPCRATDTVLLSKADVFLGVNICI